MNEFQYYTRGQSSPQGKPRVYFTAYPDDYNKYFETIRKEILDRQNSTVFFLNGETQPSTVEDYEICLKEMQLFVVPITKKLLTTNNRAIDFDIPFAFEHHIPILPLMQESGLDMLFAKRFGDLQYLDKNNTDPTAISYDEKLTNYLESVIVGDELAKKIRAAFEAYIFLSYRKKDRKYAQKLMSLIHSNPLCRDIAIWYDEFLTPGENFNEAIRKMLEKCDLFALVVTPNLINELNYVLSTEYPMANELNKDILSAELIPTDREKLSKMYEGIPEPVRVDDRENLNERLLELVQKLAVTVNDSDPTHNFFIGLAYLSGIDVEVDHERAVELITSSADAGCTEAIKKLVNMYSVGEAVKRDIDSAIKRQQQLVDLLSDKAEETYNEDDTIAVLREQMYLGEMAFSAESFELAERAFANSYEIAKLLSFGAISKTFFGKVKVLFNKYLRNKSYYNESILYLAKSCRMMLEIAYALGISDNITKWSQKAMLIVRAINKQFQDARTAVEFISLGTKLAKECAAGGNLTGARIWLDACVECMDSLADEEKSLEVRLVYSYYFDSLTDFCNASEDCIGVYNSQEDRKKLLLDLQEEFPDNELIRCELIKCFLTEAELCIRYNDLSCAEKLSDVAEELIDHETDDCNYKVQVLSSKSLLNRGVIAYCKGLYPDAEELFSQCIGIIQPISETKFDAEHKRQLVLAYERSGDCCYLTGRFTEALKRHSKAVGEIAGVVAFSKALQDIRITAELHEKLMDDCIACRKYFSVSEHYEKALWTRNALVHGVRIKSRFVKQDLSKLIESGKIESAFFIEDMKAFERLKGRQNEIMTICQKASGVDNKLIDNIQSVKIDTKFIIVKAKELIESFLLTRPVVEIRNDLKHLEYVLSKINRFSDLFDNDDISIVKVIRSVNSIQSYITKNLIPFFKYDEEGMLILAFCRFMSVSLSLKSDKERGKEMEICYGEFIKSIFMNYPTCEIKHFELWQQINALMRNTKDKA